MDQVESSFDCFWPVFFIFWATHFWLVRSVSRPPPQHTMPMHTQQRHVTGVKLASGAWIVRGRMCKNSLISSGCQFLFQWRVRGKYALQRRTAVTSPTNTSTRVVITEQRLSNWSNLLGQTCAFSSCEESPFSCSELGPPFDTVKTSIFCLKHKANTSKSSLDSHPSCNSEIYLQLDM